MNYRDAVIAALDGQRVGYQDCNSILTEIRFDLEVLQWRQTTLTGTIAAWSPVIKGTWCKRPDDKPWKVITNLVSFVEAHAAALQGKRISSTGNTYKSYGGVLATVGSGVRLLVPPSITALEWTIEEP